MPPASRGGGGQQQILVLDNGGGFVRAGWSTGASPSVSEPNCSATLRGQPGRPPLLGSEVEEFAAYNLFRPTRRGLLLDLEQQKNIWSSVLSRAGLLSFGAGRAGARQPSDCTLLLTEALGTPQSLREKVAEVLFEDLGFREVAIVPGPAMASWSPGLHAHLATGDQSFTILDLGFSACVAQPFVNGRMEVTAARRSDAGGRVLTNILLERLRLSHFDLRSSWLLAEDIFQQVAEVSPNSMTSPAAAELEIEPRTYVLPDFQAYRRGFLEAKTVSTALRKPEGKSVLAASPTGDKTKVKKVEVVKKKLQPTLAAAPLQKVVLGRERMALPEVLFRPKDFGLLQAGLTELLQQALLAVDWTQRCGLGRVALCGGLARLPGLVPRLRAELRAALPAEWKVTTIVEEEPQLSVWRGAAKFASSPHFRQCGALMTRQEWNERGSMNGIGLRKFHL